jgi:ABC-type Zn2+ transport system substrate-binding protein/surface adhesin
MTREFKGAGRVALEEASQDLLLRLVALLENPVGNSSGGNLSLQESWRLLDSQKMRKLILVIRIKNLVKKKTRSSISTLTTSKTVDAEIYTGEVDLEDILDGNGLDESDEDEYDDNDDEDEDEDEEEDNESDEEEEEG